VDDVGILVEHHQGLASTAALAEGVHGLAQAVQLIPLHWDLTLLDALQGVLRELEGVLVGGRRQRITKDVPLEGGAPEVDWPGGLELGRQARVSDETSAL